MKFAILGNSGSGKSTLAARLAQEHGLAHLDLDTVA
jgi:adenylate kinase family enzyme